MDARSSGKESPSGQHSALSECATCIEQAVCPTTATDAVTKSSVTLGEIFFDFRVATVCGKQTNGSYVVHAICLA